MKQFFSRIFKDVGTLIYTMSWYYVGMGRLARYLSIKSILLKYVDEILKPPFRMPTHIMEGSVKISETSLNF